MNMSQEFNAACFEQNFTSTILSNRDYQNMSLGGSDTSLFISKLIQRANELESHVAILSQKLAQVDSNVDSGNASIISSNSSSNKPTFSSRNSISSSETGQTDYVISGDKASIVTITKLNQLPQGEVRGITLKNCNISFVVFHQFLMQVGSSLEKLILDSVNFLGPINPQNLPRCYLGKLEEFRFTGFMSNEDDLEDDEIAQNNQKALEGIMKQKILQLKTLSLSMCTVDFDLLMHLSPKLISLELVNATGILYNNNHGSTLHSFLRNCQQLQNLSLNGESLNLYCLPYVTLKNLKLKNCFITGIPSGELTLDLAHLDSCVIDSTIGNEVGMLVKAKGFLLRCDDAMQGYNVLGSILQLDKRSSPSASGSFEINWIRLVGFFRERLLPDPKFETIDKFLIDTGVEKSLDNFTLIKQNNDWARLIDNN